MDLLTMAIISNNLKNYAYEKVKEGKVVPMLNYAQHLEDRLEGWRYNSTST
jgi:hypothetical protein